MTDLEIEPKGTNLVGITERVSFLDFYDHVRERLENKNIDISEDYKLERLKLL